MSIIKLIARTFSHYKASNFATASGIAVATAVICGALIIGDSLTHSLLQIVEYRLGNTTHTITAGERIFTQEFGKRVNNDKEINASTVLQTQGSAAVQGSNLRANRLNIWGVDSAYDSIVGTNRNFFSINHGEAIVSENIAATLNLDVGDFFLLRINAIGPIPSNTPLVSDAEQTVTRRVKIQSIATKEELGHFNLHASQSAPHNIFVNIDWLNRVLDLDNMANLVLIDASKGNVLSDYIENLTRKAWQLEDINLQLEHIANQNSWKLSSDRVFISEYLSTEICSIFPNAQPHLTYFVNSISNKGRKTPYSFVTALNNYFDIKDDEIVISQWLANDLNAKVGDTFHMSYFEVGALRELTEKDVYFRVKQIIPLKKAEKDRILMPHLPGLSDAGSCNEWDTGIPIDLDLIRQKDEDYWDDYGGTPKAYISLGRGVELWQNRFGSLTTIFIPDSLTEEQIRASIQNSIDPFKLEFQVNNIREMGVNAAKGGVDFSQLFAGLSMFIIISGLLLSVLLLNFSLIKRKNQIKLLAAMGYGRKLITRIYLSETFLIIVAGSVLGVFLAFFYSKLIFFALNHIWYDIVRTSMLNLKLNVSTLVTGFTISVIISFLTVLIGVRKSISTSLNPKKSRTKRSVNHPNSLKVIAYSLFTSSVILVLYLITFSKLHAIIPWFLAGILLFISLFVIIYIKIRIEDKPSTDKLSGYALSIKNLRRNPARSFTIALLIGLGSFVVVVTAANRKDSAIDSSNRLSGTGGFTHIAESTIPILRNLNEPESKLHYDLPQDVNFVQFLSTYGDDASCLNLNRVENPRIIATNLEQFEGRFTFVSSTEMLSKAEPWQSLNQDFGNAIPAIADQTVIQWGLGKSVGDTLTYTNSHGNELKLVLIGGLANSIFQGNVIISQENFLKHFPATSGTTFFLIDAQNEDDNQLTENISFALRDFGWEMQTTESKLAEFNSVENTYLRIFFLMGALGMLLGTIGLAVVVAKSMLERKSEIALMSALGFKGNSVVKIIFTEYFVLFSVGILAGIISALVATLPNFLQGSQNTSSSFLALVIGIIIISGIMWSLLVIIAMLRRMKLLEDLRNE